jgi:hypothetical protein
MRFIIRQNGMIVAGSEGKAYRAELEIMHYANRYRCDGDLTIQYNAGDGWKRFMYMCQWPVAKSK